MAWSITSAYPWIKTLHVISVIMWMGAQFVLTRLLMARRHMPFALLQAKAFAGIETWLVDRVMNPAMLAAFLCGAMLASTWVGEEWQIPGWLLAKFGLVLILAALHGRLLRHFWRVTQGHAPWKDGHYQCSQWLGFLLMSGVVALVVAKP